MMTRQGWEFGFWAALLVGAATAVILYQHSLHTGLVLDASSAAGRGDADGAYRPSDLAGKGFAGFTGQSRASGIWTPLGPAPDLRVFPYTPPQTFQ
jgi:hypothetical protein